MSRSTDRDLLFGLLALQNNFIDRDALVDAFHRWTGDRSQPLDRVLLDRGALSPSLHALLTGLVEEHIKRHGGDPERSLAALSSIGSAREDLARIADPDLDAGLAHVSVACQPPDDDPYRTVTEGIVGESTSTGSRFHKRRPHAKGGLGEVSVALDSELGREVALKEIQDRHADDPQSRARFVQEAEITGKLEHPGIIPVYGLGHDATGRPFYAMRFIKGDSLKEKIAAFHGDDALKRDPAARALRLRDLLRRFTDVCNAIAYAHSRGVLHRDLKPGNIMLGPFNETLVVDWGLAKSVGDALAGEGDAGPAASPVEGPIRLSGLSGSAAETVAGSPIGTPAFASPEQLTGATDRLGPATDIYGLGATLYALLTGRPPVESNDLGEVIRRVERGGIPSPRSIDPTIPRPLEAICRKAMATDPAGRYVSARALATEVTRWLDDEPVTAHREPLSARAARWMRRHRTAVTGAAAAGLVGLVGLAAVALVQVQSNRDLRDANVKTQQALEAEIKAKGETQAALAAETRAKQQTQEALARSDESRRRAEAVLGFLKEDVLAAARPEGQAGGLGVAATVRQAVDSAEPKIVARFRGQPLVEADVRETLGGTYFYLSEVVLAIRQLEGVAELRRANLGPDHPDTLTSRHNLAEAYRAAGRTGEAIALHEATLKLQEAKLGPDHPDTLASRNNLATAYHDAGRYGEAFALHEATLKLREAKLGPDHPDTLMSRHNLAEYYVAAGRIREAIPLHEAILRLRETKLGPDHPNTLMSRINLAAAYQLIGRTDDALRMHEATLKRSELKLGPAHSYSISIRNNLAAAYLDAGRTDDAIELQKVTLEMFESKFGPDHPSTLVSKGNLAKAYRVAGRLDEAVALFERVFDGFRAKSGPDHPATLKTELYLAETCSDAGRDARAETLLRDCLERTRKRFGATESNTAAAMAALGEHLVQQRRWTEAEPVLRECLVIREKAQPDVWSTFHICSLLGGSLMGQGKPAEAEPLILIGYEGLKAREARIPAPYKSRVQQAAERVVRLYESWGKPDKAAEWGRKLGLADLPADVFAPP